MEMLKGKKSYVCGGLLFIAGGLYVLGILDK